MQCAGVDVLAKPSVFTKFREPRLYLAVHWSITCRRGDVGSRAPEAALVLDKCTTPILVAAILTLNINNGNGSLRQTFPVGDSPASNPARHQ